MSTQKIINVRASIAAKKAEREANSKGRLSHAELNAAIGQQVGFGAVAERGLAYRVGAAAYEDGMLFARANADGRIDLLPPLVALFGADTVRDLLARFVDRVPDAPSAADRKARLVALDAEIEKLEVAEERLIRAVEASGGEVVRRADANPAVVLADL